MKDINEKQDVLKRISTLERRISSAQNERDAYANGKYKNHSNRKFAEVLINEAIKELEQLNEQLKSMDGTTTS